jgi:hypothetical protein
MPRRTPSRAGIRSRVVPGLAASDAIAEDDSPQGHLAPRAVVRQRTTAGNSGHLPTSGPCPLLSAPVTSGTAPAPTGFPACDGGRRAATASCVADLALPVPREQLGGGLRVLTVDVRLGVSVVSRSAQFTLR